MATVGVSSTAFHACSGEAKKAFRKLDYLAIAYTSIFAARCALPEMKRAFSVVSACVAPFSPATLTGINWVFKQFIWGCFRTKDRHEVRPLLFFGEFQEDRFRVAKRVQAQGMKRLVNDWQGHRRAHLSVTLMSFLLFAAEEIVPEIPFVHAWWHISSSIGMHYLERGLLST